MTRPALLRGTVAAAAAAMGTYLLVVQGALTLDLGVGRRVRALGPQRVRVAAPRDTVFDVIAGPYLGRTPRAMQAKLKVLERGTDMVLAAHMTPAPLGLKAVTLETVRFEPPGLISFRLVRGPVPYVVETFSLTATEAGTDFEYRGELGTDLWGFGAAWGDRVARAWERAVAGSLEQIRIEAERRSR